MCSRSNDSKWVSSESFISLFIGNSCQPKSSQRSPRTQLVNFVCSSSRGLNDNPGHQVWPPFNQCFVWTLQIFKEGKKATKERALKKGIHLVSVLWVESCRQSGKRISEDLFPVVESSEVGTPLMVGRLRRTKSMQPKAFEEDVQNSAGAYVIFVKATQCNFHLEPEVAATFEQNRNWCNVLKWFFICNLIVTKIASSCFCKNCMCKQNFWMIARVF